MIACDVSDQGENPLEVVRTLLNAGADVNAKTKGGWTAWLYAYCHDFKEITALLAEAGADTSVNANAADLDGKTPLILASEYGHSAVARALIAAGADVNAGIDNAARDKGKTALLFACERKHWEAAKVLIAAGADVNAKDRFRRTALLHACKSGNMEVFRMLIHAGADVNAWSVFGDRPLTAASVNGDIEAVQTLIQAGAEVVGLTVLEKAKTREIYKLLKRACIREEYMPFLSDAEIMKNMRNCLKL